MKLPFLKFWVADWLSDESLRMVSLSAKGLWIEMLCIMARSPEHGRLLTSNGQPMTNAQLARLVASTEEEITPLVGELGDAGVFSVDRNGTIFSRRMVRDEKERKLNRDRVFRWRNGDVMPDVMVEKCSGNGAEARGKSQEANNNRPDKKEWMAYAGEIKWQKSGAESAFDYYESIGWLIGGKTPVKDWKACARNCHKRSLENGDLSKKKEKPAPIPQNYSPPSYKIAGFASYSEWAEAGCPAYKQEEPKK